MWGGTVTKHFQNAADFIVWLGGGCLGLDLGGQSLSGLGGGSLGDLDGGSGSHKGGEG